MKDETPIEEGVLNLRLSDVRTWLQCPRRFFFEVLQQLYPQPETPAAESASEVEYEIDESNVVVEREARRRDEGTMAHAVAEAWYKGELDPYLLDPTERLYAIDRIVDAKASELTTDIEAKSWSDARRYAKAAGRGFPGWIEHEGHDVATKVLAVEERFGTKLPFPYSGKHDSPFHTIHLTGQPDVVQEDEIIEVVQVGDTKHVGSLKNTGPRSNDFQLVGYGWIYEKATGQRVSWGYQNLMLRSLQTAKATPPFYKRVPVAITTDKLNAFERHLRSTLTDMARWIVQLNAGRDPGDLRYSETQLCDWMCNTRLLCDDMGSGAQGAWQETANAYYGGSFADVFDD